MEDDHQERQEIAARAMIRIYHLIAKLMADLPLPIGIPALRNSVYGDEVEAGLIRAYKSLVDLPMREDIQTGLRQMILDWITASDALFRFQEEERGWILDLVEMQIARLSIAGQMVLELLTGEDL